MNDAVILERAIRLSNYAIKTVMLQHRRIRTTEPEDSTFLFRRWSDLQFFIVTLEWLHASAKIAIKVSNTNIASGMVVAINEFEKAVPGLRKLRNVGEHLDEYAVDAGKDPTVSRRQLEVGQWHDPVFNWLEVTLNIDDAKVAAETLFKTLQTMRKFLSDRKDKK